MNLQIYISIIAAATTSLAAAHDHFDAGIWDTNQNNAPDAGEPLRLIGADLTTRVFHLLARPVGQTCGGYYMLNENVRSLLPLDSFSFTALSDGQAVSGDINFAHTGTDIWMEITAVAGPLGANFGFWEMGQADASETPTISFPTNSPTGKFAFAISEPLPWLEPAEQDPFGHIHGRCWTADRPGDYSVSYRLVDRSTCGPGGGPWHSPSPTYVFHYKAGPDFQPVVTRVDAKCVLTWSSLMGIWEPYQSGIVFGVQRSTSLATADWVTIGSVTGTTATIATFTDAAPLPGRAFYRLSFDWSTR